MERVDARLPLSRLDSAQTYLVAWDGDDPVGHAHVAWDGTDVGIPEVQDVFVLESHRRRGVARRLMARVEQIAAEAGHRRIAVGHSADNEAARRVYAGLGYRDTGLEPKRVHGTITIRGRATHVDETIVYLVKDLPVDFGDARSS